MRWSRLLLAVLFVGTLPAALAATPALSLDYPSGGQVFIAGTTQVVRVGPRPRVSPITVELSTDGGVTFSALGTITVTKLAAPSLSFTVPNTPSSNCIVRISGAPKGKPAESVSSAPFAIFASFAGGATAVPGSALADGSITNSKLAPLAVSSDKITSGQASDNFVLTADGSGNATWTAAPPISPAWLLGGNKGTNPATHFLGTTDNTALEVRVNNTRAVRIEPAANATTDAPAIIHGFSGNSVGNGTVGGTIGGGGSNGNANTITNDYGTIAGGNANTADFLAAIGGGIGNLATGGFSAIGGGESNQAGDHAFVGGGLGNSADVPGSGNSAIAGGINNIAGGGAFIGAGEANTANAQDGFIGGGINNSITFPFSAIGGGSFNSTQGSNNTIGGGGNNSISAGSDFSTIAGGANNQVTAVDSFAAGFVGGGDSNIVSGILGAVGGGSSNEARGNNAAVCGGSINLASGVNSFIGGGDSNLAGGNFSVIPGGQSNTTSPAAPFSFAAGQQAQANHPGAFVWADSTNAAFASTANDQFLIRASGGVGIGTPSPGANLEVKGAASQATPVLQVKNSAGNVSFAVEARAGNAGTENTFVGLGAGAANTSGDQNAFFGRNAGNANATGSFNAFFGTNAGKVNTANSNTFFGQNAGMSNTTGNSNVFVGVGAGASNVGGAGNAGSFNTFCGEAAGNRNIDGELNTFLGADAGLNNFSGNDNVFTGAESGVNNQFGSSNTFNGHSAGANNDGDNNTFVGDSAGTANTSGANNIALGVNAGSNLTTGNNNIDIFDPGVAAEANTIRIGTNGTQTKTFVAGIRGVTTGANDAIPVMIDSNGQLGTVSSSRRYKEDIADMGDVSARLQLLRPVTFHYKQPMANGAKPIQYGLIAEEVAAVFPELTVFNQNGQPETVKYHLLAPLLLNEYLKEHAQVSALEARVQALEKLMAQQPAQH